MPSKPKPYSKPLLQFLHSNSNPEMFKISSIFLLHFIHKRSLNTISTSTLPLPSVSTLEFLKNSCRLSSESPSSVSGRKFQFHEKNIQKYEAIIGFLKSHGFEDSDIAKLVSKQPFILHSKLSNNLKPKFEFLQEIGFVGPLLLKLLLSNPSILFRNLDSQLKPSFFFLKEVLESDEQVTTAIRHSPWLLTSDFKGILKSNIGVLASEGVPSSNIAKLIAYNSRTIMKKVDRMIEVVKMVKELGIEPKSARFLHALRVRGAMSDSTWKKKINVLKSLGWSENEIFTLFKRQPICLARSEDAFRDIADFCLNTAKLNPETVISYPKFFTFSVDKLLRPRYKVLEVLMVKNLLKNKRIALTLLRAERVFVENYVLKHLDEIPQLMDIYRGNVTAETSSVL